MGLLERTNLQTCNSKAFQHLSLEEDRNKAHDAGSQPCASVDSLSWTTTHHGPTLFQRSTIKTAPIIIGSRSLREATHPLYRLFQLNRISKMAIRPDSYAPAPVLLASRSKKRYKYPAPLPANIYDRPYEIRHLMLSHLDPVAKASFGLTCTKFYADYFCSTTKSTLP